MNPVLPERIRDLLAWADYIVEFLHRDPPHDPGRIAELRELLGEPALRDLRLQAWGLRERLDRARILSETATSNSAFSAYGPRSTVQS